jgi:hypothetical protein
LPGLNMCFPESSLFSMDLFSAFGLHDRPLQMIGIS